MSINFRLPNITADTPEGKLRQMQRFLYQTVEQLNWAMNAIETGTISEGQPGTASKSGAQQEQQVAARFNEVKALIIKSADIVNAYYETINQKLSGVYVAQSDFGIYEQITDQSIKGNSEKIEQIFTNLQSIITDLEGLEHSLIETNANIRSGLLYYNEDGVPMYGLEIGQKTEIDGEEVFNKYARFTSEKLSFYDSSGNEVAYISDRTLHITDIEVSGTFSHGGFVDEVIRDSSGNLLGIVTKWAGGS